ncbi:MAG: DUF4038 domain-containing protein [Fimbriimonadales bacterium]|nr:DUF4038 domain-containing protein [Fimbriimonadales bacterium]
MQRLRVASDGRTLCTEDGQPFFWLGDTAWELLHHASRDEIVRYLEVRQRQGFNVVQTVFVPEIEGPFRPNAEGQLPLTDLDDPKPSEGYLGLASFLLDQAELRGIRVALLPTWGSWAVEEKHPLFRNKRIFHDGNSEAYARRLAEALGDRPNLVYVLGGDRDPKLAPEVWRAMARGIRSAVGDRCLITYHPTGLSSSGDLLHHEPWLDFHMIQTGHVREVDPAWWVQRDWLREPPKPTLLGEPAYEAIPDRLERHDDLLDADDVRLHWYAAVFAGSIGVTYGCNAVWMCWEPRWEPIADIVPPPFLAADQPWLEALHKPGAEQARWLQDLFCERSLIGRTPESLIGGRWALHGDQPRPWTLVWLPFGGELRMTARFDPSRLEWHDPRTGATLPAHNDGPSARCLRLRAPDNRDWVLSVDA